MVLRVYNVCMRLSLAATVKESGFWWSSLIKNLYKEP